MTHSCNAMQLVQRFERLWQNSIAPPDVFSFLTQFQSSSVEERLSVLLVDQVRRWTTDEPITVEDYLAHLPDLGTESDVKLRLAVGEFMARQKSQTVVDADQFVSRFSEISEQLRDKLSQLDRVNESDEENLTRTRSFMHDRTPDRSVRIRSSGSATTTLFVSNKSERKRSVGRYRLDRVLGEGAFGRVYLAFDEELHRQVAVKIPNHERFRRPEDAEQYLQEARIVASLDHPNIVPVYDTGRTEDGTIYVVSKYIDGQTLSERSKGDPLGIDETVKLLSTVAHALHHAHQHQLIHRDVKPSNILLEGTDAKPYLADFGLAIREHDYLKNGVIAGTPAYMSPEQARGEGHRIDGRSDIFALGVIQYELLTGTRPFHGATPAELLRQLSTLEPQSPREIDAKIPAELERICRKALSKKAADRYQTAAELAEDLLQWNQSPQQIVQELQVVPRGLRSFETDDAGFYLQLLPGPRNRNGLPECIQFWKKRIEETDPDETFPVGLIYGPSGCGKSSLVKAGLLPHLSDEVVALYIESTADDTESRILNGLRKRCPDLHEASGLVETFASLRRHGRRKVFVVLDQFEQWLHAHRSERDTELVTALRQCDGGVLQGLVMVRDDFAMAAARFMDLLDIPLLQGRNFATVDLFDVDHAEVVLVKFGQAFGKLPRQTGKMSLPQRDFVATVASGLAQDGKVVSVRLALFADMIKGKPWVPETLEKVGGTEGIGVNFLDETFHSRHASPQHRLHQQAAREVLKALLPGVGTEIKGHMRSHSELLVASGYQKRSDSFGELLRILDEETRLITPTTSDGERSDDHGGAGTKFYQLTHDYLVSALRQWLARKQIETRKGRAELKLAERAALWDAKPEKRHLPSLMEWAGIRLLTDSRRWTQPQQKMMDKAGWAHGLRMFLLLIVMGVVGLSVVKIRHAIVEAEKLTQAEELVESLRTAKTSQVPGIIENLSDLRDWADPLLAEQLRDTTNHSPEKLHLSLALLPVDSRQLDYLRTQLTTGSLDQFSVVCEALIPYRRQMTEGLWALVTDDKNSMPDRRFRAAAALAVYDPDDDRWQHIVPFVTQYLTDSLSRMTFSDWLERLAPAAEQLAAPIAAIHSDRSRPADQLESAAFALARYWRSKPMDLVGAIIQADQSAEFSPLLEVLKPHASIVKQTLVAEMQTALPDRLRGTNQMLSADHVRLRDAHLKRQSLAAVALVGLGFDDEVWPLLTFHPDPSLRSFMIHYLGKLKTDHDTLATRLKLEPDVSIRRALIQSLGGLDATQIPQRDRQRIAEQLERLYTLDADPGIHGSSAWALRKWGRVLPELPVGQPVPSQKQKNRAATIRRQIADLENRIADQEREIRAVQVAEWAEGIAREHQELSVSLREGLSFHYSFDVPPDEDAVSPTGRQPAIDWHGGAPPNLTEGVVGDGIELRDGSFVTGLPISVDTSMPLSVGGWFLFRDRSKPMGLLSNRDKRDRFKGIELFLPASRKIVFKFHGRSGWFSCNTKRAFPTTNCWHHVMVTYDGTRSADGVTVYVNGKIQDLSRATSGMPLESEVIESPEPLHFGTRPRGLFEFTPLEGMVDDVRVYDRRLTPDETVALYLQGVANIASRFQAVTTSEQQGSEQQWATLSMAFAQLAAAPRPDASPLESRVQQLTRELLAMTRRWYVNDSGQTMVIIPKSETEKVDGIEHSFAIADHDVTIAEYRRMQSELPSEWRVPEDQNCPMGYIDWYGAARYCNWLSEQEGIEEDQLVYAPNADGEYDEGMIIKENWSQLTGYRLPTNAECVAACRAGTKATCYFGEPLELLPRYAWFASNAAGQTHPVASLLPNDWGLFDMQGQVFKWCHNHVPGYGPLTPVVTESRRYLSGSSYKEPAWETKAEFGAAYRSWTRVHYFGFRLAKTILLQPLP